MKFHTSCLFILIAITVGSTNLWSQSLDSPQDKATVEMWPDKLWTDLSRQVDLSGTQLTNVLFDQIDNFNLWTTSRNNFATQFSVKRSVFDNQDILNTYTVNDQFSVNLGKSATAYSIPLAPSLITPINFNLGVGGKLVFNHIRQVFSKKYPELPQVEEIQKEVSAELREIEEEEQKWWSIDPNWRPRLSKFWNPLITMWRIPWTKEGLNKIKSGDLISYSTSGYVSVGVESGFLPLKVAPGLDLSLGLGLQIYVKGEFRITLLKESERFVRVKVTHLKSLGQAFTAGARTNDIRVMDGILLFEGKKLEYQISDQNISVIPFKFTVSN